MQFVLRPDGMRFVNVRLKASGLVLVLAIAGCFYETEPVPEEQTFERLYPQTFGEVWAAAVSVMDKQYHIIANSNDYVIDTTEWNFDLVRDEKRGIHSDSFKEKYKLQITVQTAKEGILLTIRPFLERRVDTGEYSFEWVRKHSENQWDEHIETGRPRVEWHRVLSDGRREHRIMAQIEDYLNRRTPVQGN